MSGFIVVVGSDGEAAREAVERALPVLRRRAPDGAAVRVLPEAALAFTLLRVGGPQPEPMQPVTLDEASWLVGHLRLDDRGGLARVLGLPASELTTLGDAHLILHAYRRWGAALLDHIAGDFSFAIWDARERELFCARDHFGVRPLYYAQLPGQFIVGNTLAAVRAVPGISAELDELAVADFLMGGHALDMGATSFRAIRRLPPAHSLRRQNRTLQVSRYWRIPVDRTLRFQSAAEYAEALRDRLAQAVADRLPDGPAGILLSGGLDSTTIAGLAVKQGADLDAVTIGYSHLVHDPEPESARLAANALGIRQEIWFIDDEPIFAPLAEAPYWPEPWHDALGAVRLGMLQRVTRRSRVVLSGDAGDHVLAPQFDHFRARLARGELRAFAREAMHYVRAFHTPPPIGVRSALRALWPEPDGHEPEPWLRRDLVDRLALRDRWQRERAGWFDDHPQRSRAQWILSSPLWPAQLEYYDHAAEFTPLEVRQPFLDLRVVDLVFAAPAGPWFFQKLLLREAMRGILPDAIRLRPKTAFVSDPLLLRLRQRGADWGAALDAPGFGRWVDLDALPVRIGAGLPDRAYEPFLVPHAISFARWLTIDAQTQRSGLAEHLLPADAGATARG